MSYTLDENLNVIADGPVEIQILDGDLAFISKLDDEPNDVGGMTAAELKAEFDKAGLAIQKYLNETLVPKIIADDLTESARAAAEADRVASEAERKAAETQREIDEDHRIQQAYDFAGSENRRVTSEKARVAAEIERANAEAARVAAEEERVNSTNGIVAQAANSAAAAAANAQSAAESKTAAAQSVASAAASAHEVERHRAAVEELYGLTNAAKGDAEKAQQGAERAQELAEQAQEQTALDAALAESARQEAHAAADRAEAARDEIINGGYGGGSNPTAVWQYGPVRGNTDAAELYAGGLFDILYLHGAEIATKDTAKAGHLVIEESSGKVYGITSVQETSAGIVVFSVGESLGTIKDDSQAVADAIAAAEGLAKEASAKAINAQDAAIGAQSTADEAKAAAATAQSAAAGAQETADGKEAKGTAAIAVSTHNTNPEAHGDIRDLISGLTTRLNTLVDSDDTTLDQLSEIVAYIKSNKALIDAITTSKVNVSDIIDNLTTNVSNKPLSAAQGVALKALVDAAASAAQAAQGTADEAKSTADEAKAIADGNARDIGTMQGILGPLAQAYEETVDDVNNHIKNKSNPHGVTATQVGAPTVQQMNDAIAAASLGGGGGGATSWDDLGRGYGIGELLEETTLTAANTTLSEALPLTAGYEYTVRWNGTEYVCTAKDISAMSGVEGSAYVGNFSGSTAEPFFISYKPGEGTTVDIVSGSAPATVSISGYGMVTKPIPGKYLPEGTPWIEEGGMVEILPEYTINGEEDIAAIPALGLVEGNTYIVKLLGNTYTCVAWVTAIEGVSVVGLGDIYTSSGGAAGTEATGEPFILIEFPPDAAAEYGMNVVFEPLVEMSFPIVLSIVGDTAKPHKLDPRCLPDSTPSLFNAPFTQTDDGMMPGKTFEEIYATAAKNDIIIRAIFRTATGQMYFMPLQYITPEFALYGIALQTDSNNKVFTTIRHNADDTVAMFTDA